VDEQLALHTSGLTRPSVCVCAARWAPCLQVGAALVLLVTMLLW
jgi:hypothetical protein